MSKERKVKFTVPTQITGTRPLVDGCMSINFHTNELTDEDKLQVIKSLNGVGWLLFSENEIQEEEIPEGDADMQRKSQSQRIRACLFVLWKNKGGKGEFVDFYKAYTEKVINWLKRKM